MEQPTLLSFKSRLYDRHQRGLITINKTPRGALAFVREINWRKWSLAVKSRMHMAVPKFVSNPNYQQNEIYHHVLETEQSVVEELLLRVTSVAPAEPSATARDQHAITANATTSHARIKIHCHLRRPTWNCSWQPSTNKIPKNLCID